MSSAPTPAPGVPVVLSPGPGEVPDALATLVDAAAAARDTSGRAAPAVELAARVGAWAPLPGSGHTLRRWELLATLAAADLTAARVAEAHLDALAIVAEAGLADAGLADAGLGDGTEDGPTSQGARTWGVFAAEAPGVRLDALLGPAGWRLTGTKPWCSLAGLLTDALVTAHTGDGRRLFWLRLTGDGVRVHDEGAWVSRGLAAVPSVGVDLDDAPAVPVGDAGWYLRRSGFAWGGLGVAACWYGGAVGVARRLLASGSAREPDQVALVHLGGVDVALAGARALLAGAAAAVDAGTADGAAGAALATRVRSGVAAAAEEVLTRVAHALGPAPLAFEEPHARRVADLQVYLRQHHAERDLAALGADVLAGRTPPAGELPW